MRGRAVTTVLQNHGAIAELQVAEIGCTCGGTSLVATVEFESVPAAIDSFVDELRRMRRRVGDVATLSHS